MKKAWALIAGVALAALVAPSGALAQEPSGTTEALCSMSFPQNFSPGVTMTPSSGAQSGNGGFAGCTGTLQGQKITGPGTVSNEGRLDNANCLIDHTFGTYRLSVPTESGPLSIEGTYDVVRTGFTFNILTWQPGATGSGSGIAVPTKGDCFLTPMTEAQILMTIRLTDSPAPPQACDLDLGVLQLSCRTRSAI